MQVLGTKDYSPDDRILESSRARIDPRDSPLWAKTRKLRVARSIHLETCAGALTRIKASKWGISAWVGTFSLDPLH